MSGSKFPYKYTEDIKGYQDAVWDYLMEHCDITDKGAFFVKFHTDSKKDFLNRILGRWKYNYHRSDPIVRHQIGQERKKKFLTEKEQKRQAYLQSKKERRAEQEAQKEKERLAQMNFKERFKLKVINLIKAI